MLGDNSGLPATQDTTTSSSGAFKKGILSIEHRSLNPSNELKRIFGSKVIQNEQRLVNY